MTTPTEDFEAKIDGNNRRIAIEERLKGKLQEEVDRLKTVIENLQFDNKTYEIAILKLAELAQPQPGSLEAGADVMNKLAGKDNN